MDSRNQYTVPILTSGRIFELTENKKCYITYGTYGGGEVNDFGKVFLEKQKAIEYCIEQEKITHQRWEYEDLELE